MTVTNTIGYIILVVMAYTVIYFMFDWSKLPFSQWHLIWILPLGSALFLALMVMVAGTLATPTGIYWE